jgi:hypothetical protein
LDSGKRQNALNDCNFSPDVSNTCMKYLFETILVKRIFGKLHLALRLGFRLNSTSCRVRMAAIAAASRGVF